MKSARNGATRASTSRPQGAAVRPSAGSTAMMPMTRVPMRGAALAPPFPPCSGRPARCARWEAARSPRHPRRSWRSTSRCGSARGAVTGEIHGDDGVVRLEGVDLRVPVVGIAGPAVHQHDGRLAVPEHPVFDVHVVLDSTMRGPAPAACRALLRRLPPVGGAAAPAAWAAAASAQAASSRASSSAAADRHSLILAQHFAGIQDAVRVEGLLYRAHQIQLHRRGVALELPDLQGPIPCSALKLPPNSRTMS